VIAGNHAMSRDSTAACVAGRPARPVSGGFANPPRLNRFVNPSDIGRARRNATPSNRRDVHSAMCPLTPDMPAVRAFFSGRVSNLVEKENAVSSR
jgi:hypothetical protein